MGLLGAGGLATATSFVRLGLLVQPGSFDDLTVSFVRFNLLGYVIRIRLRFASLADEGDKLMGWV
jgi:hypothetical protein